jgi:hypothetical protein
MYRQCNSECCPDSPFEKEDDTDLPVSARAQEAENFNGEPPRPLFPGVERTELQKVLGTEGTPAKENRENKASSFERAGQYKAQPVEKNSNAEAELTTVSTLIRQGCRSVYEEAFKNHELFK